MSKYSKKTAMNTQLTLDIENTLFEKARVYAESKGITLSEIVEEYLKYLTKNNDVNQDTSIPITASLRGAFKAPARFIHKKELSKVLSEKYL